MIKRAGILREGESAPLGVAAPCSSFSLLYNSASGIGPVFILLGDFYMKKTLILSIALAALIGCQKKEAPKAVDAPAAPAAEAPAAAPAAPAPAPTTDKK